MKRISGCGGSLRWLLLLASVWQFSGCGGGSVVMGVSNQRRSYEGRTVDSNSVPIVGTLVTLLNTGQSTRSGADGRFFLGSDFDGAVAQLEFRTGSLQKTFDIASIDRESAGVQLNIVLQPGGETFVLSQLDVSVQVRGTCDLYFENTRVIRQSGRLDDGTICSLRVEMRSQGQPLEAVPFLLQRRRCLEGAPWHDEAIGLTGATTPPSTAADSPDTDSANGMPPGVARLPFAFFNDEAHCVYRVVAPNLPAVDPVLYEIHTFRKQDFDAGKQ